ncbi:MAG: hypothetical protein OMM_03810 [Candidatus Magnetoglobus multicellularis str. Araruama]|uniref:LamG-like jellyroll fold domain-containing protein n=1 Tax=Candidatus Magnetoglobus multicellularis str. Araruama TaxID=890399 RepID=A0A1V1P4A2_9BACT|nr:MAG: hypothetical protein OMM_03810 [Candidatus Magnetoglobus multicellularis str. Araruama]
MINKLVSTGYYWRTNYHAQMVNYNTSGWLVIGRGFTANHFQGKIKDLKLSIAGGNIGTWDFTDGNQSNTAKDSNYRGNHMTLRNFDTKNCWFINPDLTKSYEFDQIQERQTVPKFKMTGNAKVTYDWGRQHAVIVNTLPDDLNKLVTVKNVYDDTQDSNSGAGKYWYHHGSNVSIKALEDSCQKLSGYRDNVADPTKMIRKNEKIVDELTEPENLSWVYSPYLFEETVAIGSPIVLSNLPPALLQKMDLSQKPKYISTEVSEQDMCYWNGTDMRMYPLKAGAMFDLEYNLNDSVCIGIKVIVRVKTIWPDTPHIIHIAKTPPVNLDPKEDDDVAFIDIKHVEADGTVASNKFSAEEKGRSVLHFMRNYIDNTLPKEISVSFDGNGYIETEPLGLPDNFTIEFYAKRHRLNDLNAIIGQGKSSPGEGLSIGFTDENHLFFDIYGNSLKSTGAPEDQNWHHWACVYETDVSNISTPADRSEYISTNSFTCDNTSSNYQCRWKDDRCFTEEFIGDYDVKDDIRYWNPLAKVKRRCGVNIKYSRKIYCDGELVASAESDMSYIGQGKLRIGKTGEGYIQTLGFKGQVDEVRIWSEAKTQSQITANMSKSLSGNESNLLAYFPMDRIGSSF